MTEQFPDERKDWADAEAVQSMEVIMSVISSIRTIRSEADLHPTAPLEANIFCKDQIKREVLEQFAPSIKNLTRSGAVLIHEGGTVPDDAGHILVGDIEVFVPLKGLINAEEELAKLGKELGKLEKELARVSGKLKNEKFLSKAPAQIVEKERGIEQELQGRIAKNRESSTRLNKLL